ncbi:Rpn family recombination-promoting nuclease/putative transposase [Rickettsia felis]|uniref:Rpn family recombination-promoting nuclease/putative transposase n=1 Tax=Rickettsia felis TaxID=42862 RepID=UPI000B2D9510|nr:Rpn family recombination-promoting nuclease/putative transposase [Rickettsia felis]
MNNKNIPKDYSEVSVADTKASNRHHEQVDLDSHNTSERPRHDALIRKALENPLVAKEFFEMHLPKEIKAMFSSHTLKMEKESFVEADLKHSISDIHIEAVGNITRLHSKILSQATNLKSIKLDDTSAATSFELDLNIKDLKIDPYSIALSEVQDSFKYVIENILKEAREEKSESAYSSKQDSLEPKAIKGITNIDGKACINFKELDSKHQSKIIAICLKRKYL